jgi:hypothetical protein
LGSRQGCQTWQGISASQRGCNQLPMKKQHEHNFVNEYDGMVAFGFSREVDEKSLMYYLQKFSDDDLMKLLAPRLSDAEINQIFELLSHLMRKHLNDGEYHEYFLKDDGHHTHHH